MRRARSAGRALAAACALSGCQLWQAPLPDPECADVPIDVEHELLATGAWLRGDDRARNANEGALGFSARLSGYDASALFDLVGSPLAGGSSDAPFRLLALVNRTDLAEQLAPESPAGEARLVYTLTAGSGDDPAAPALPFTVIFEYTLGSTERVGDWARAFHAVHGADDAVALVTRFTTPQATPGGPHLAQVRVNDARSGSSKLYELAPNEQGVLVARGLRNTPRPELAGTPQLAAFLTQHAAAINVGQQRVPEAWLATATALQEVAWLPSAPQLEHDFARGTCGGCHGTEGPGQAGFHLRQIANSDVELSTFLTNEELPRRARVMRQRLCEPGE